MIASVDRYVKKPFLIALRSFPHMNRPDTGSFHDQQAKCISRDRLRKGKSTTSYYTCHELKPNCCPRGQMKHRNRWYLRYLTCFQRHRKQLLRLYIFCSRRGGRDDSGIMDICTCNSLSRLFFRLAQKNAISMIHGLPTTLY